MVNDEIVIAIALIFAVIVLITVKIIEFFVRFNNETRYFTMEMRRACDYNEYRRWRGELRCHYLCLIPFVNERNVMWLYRRIYHKPKHEKTKKRSDGLYHVLAPSVISIFICAVCLCGVSWAWFTSSQTSNVANIQTATYIIDVTAKENEISAEVTNNSGIYTVELKNGKTYEITITANGTAKSGYCTIKLGEQIYHTPQIEKDADFTFKVNAYQNGELTITPQWGTCTATENIIEAETTLELGTIAASDNNEPENNNATATPQVIPATPENTTPTVDTDTETTAPADTDEQSSDNNITEQEQEPEETTETDFENK